MTRSYLAEARRQVAPPAVRIGPIVERLDAAYPGAGIALHYAGPLELLVAVMLSAQTTDAQVNLVTESLFSKYRHPEDYLAAGVEELERDLQPTGFYRAKARSLLRAMAMLVDEFGGEVPTSVEQLMRLPGVGAKTANMVAAELGQAQGIAVDTHVARVAQRLGLSEEDDPVRIERDLERLVPRTTWQRFSYLLIRHGRQVCAARRPRCAECVLEDLCPSSRLRR